MSLVLDGVGLRAGADEIIAGVSMMLERGTMNVLLGPTLAGKTTLMRLMAGLERPTVGRILLDGRDTVGVGVRKRSVAMVYQQFVNYPSLSVRENIASPLRVAGVARAEIERRVAEAARVLRLEPMLDRLPAQLSGGQQQRTAIARALVKRADLVLLDEPLANLDYKLREELRAELPRIFGESGAILVYATTEPSEALLLRGRTATMSEGRVTQVGETAAVYRAPATIEAARVFSDPPLNEMVVVKAGPLVATEGGRSFPAPAVMEGLPDAPYRVAFRVEHALLGTGTAAGLRFAGHVLATQLSGGESFVHVDVGGGTRLVALVRGLHDWAPGAAAEVQVDPRGLFAFDAAGRTIAADPRSLAG